MAKACNHIALPVHSNAWDRCILDNTNNIYYLIAKQNDLDNSCKHALEELLVDSGIGYSLPILPG